VRQWVLDTHGPAYPCHEAVLVHVERALPVDSPAYTFGHAREDELERSWAATYQAGRARAGPAGHQGGGS
jgi:hypothetical protein